MKVLISFCNTKGKKGNPNLLLLNVLNGKQKWIDIDIDNKGFRGLAIDAKYIYTLYQKKTLGTLVIINRSNFGVVLEQDLPKLLEPHSMLLDKGCLYIVSAGNDQIQRYELNYDDLSVSYKDIFWFPKGSKHKADTHHINSIYKFQGQFFISGLGLKKGEKLSTARNGYVCNITSGQEEIGNIYHPHSIIITKAGIYFCESATRRVKLNQKTLITLKRGYIRGLWTNDEILVVGTSSGRKHSRSTKKVNNIWDPGQLESACDVSVYDLKARIPRLINKFDFLPAKKEIYEIISYS